MTAPTNIFFLGKGGVGKSTAAALNSLFLARKGFQVLLISLDPAHNQADIFAQTLADRPREVAPRLQAMEVDLDRWIKRYLEEVQRQIRRTYSYLTAFNLDTYFRVIRHAPGLEEHALVLAFNHLRQKYADRDFLVFDMPPTALALRFFGLPALSLVWIEQLQAMRREILAKKEMITRVRFGAKEIERDKVLGRIGELARQYEELRRLFQHRETTRIHLVLNPDKLSLAESLRIVRALRDLDMDLALVINNKVEAGATCALSAAELDRTPMLNFPQAEEPLLGITALESYLAAHGHQLETQLPPC